MSIAGGLPSAVHGGVAAGCGVVQIFVNHPRLGTLPMLLETPRRDDGDARNLATLWGLRRRGRADR